MRLFLLLQQLAFWLRVRAAAMWVEDFAWRRSRRADERVKQAQQQSGG